MKKLNPPNQIFTKKTKTQILDGKKTAPNVLLENVSYSYPDAKETVLEGMNIQFDSGSFNVVLGRSGDGKSTLLRLVAGLYQPDKGEIFISGEKPLYPSLDRSLIFQQTQLFPWMKLEQNINFVYKKAHPEVDSKTARNKAVQLLQNVDLEKFVNMYPYQLSGGMLQRAAFAASMAQGASLWLMDEPFAALDPDTRAKARQLILDIWKNGEAGRTMIFVTHDVDETLELAQKVYYLENKKIKKELDLRGLNEDKRFIMRKTLINLFWSNDEKE
ncbi:MAG: ABC transporter ATP-binding protein [Treponema sp.]|nr:ABC transporter ATP-binding protein [Treponema sp.]